MYILFDSEGKVYGYSESPTGIQVAGEQLLSLKIPNGANLSELALIQNTDGTWSLI
jgi:hypothetical protein